MTEISLNTQFNRSIEEEEEDIQERNMKKKLFANKLNTTNTFRASLMRFVN